MSQITLSHSQMTTVLTCPRKWQLGYIEGLEKKPGVSARNWVFGSAFHAGIARAIELLGNIGVLENVDYVHKHMIAEGSKAIAKYITENTEEDVRTYEGLPDIDYYDMMQDISREASALLAWFVPVSELGTRYMPVRAYEIFEGAQTECSECNGLGVVDQYCDHCEGSGYVDVDCDECYGEGHTWDEEEEEYVACGSCEGDGYYEDICDYCDGYGSIEVPCDHCDDGVVEDTTLMIEYPFEYKVNDAVAVRGFVDVILRDTETGEIILVDFKTRTQMQKEDAALIDGQVHTYDAVLAAMGAKIDTVRIWQIRRTPPAPAYLLKKGNKPSKAKPGGAVKSTTYPVWFASLPEEWQEKYPTPESAEEIGSIRPLEYFSMVSDAVPTDVSRRFAMDNLAQTGQVIRHYKNVAENGAELPGIHSGMNCPMCDFSKLCATVFRYGGDATEIIETEYQRRAGYSPVEGNDND